MITFTVVLVAIVVFLVYDSYMRHDGKFEIGNTLKCLCQVEGDDCVGAQILGGRISLPNLEILGR